jgi:hypothetical protein
VCVCVCVTGEVPVCPLILTVAELILLKLDKRSVDQFQFPLKLDNNDGHLVWSQHFEMYLPTYVFKNAPKLS